ncbi:NUDIX domain-containing protein [Sphingobium sp. CFD-1]|uniref:NUDIX domain-containing protein n=1 Tax=Sphingobium sp. CFD-1 TaxID=2878545 RepID=UPI00214CAF67|nr:NUDIX hydrolase [Sphingobium sp. CFD-1]
MAKSDRLLNTASLIVLHPSHSELLCVRHPTFGIWMFAGGKIELGEPPHHAAVREVIEEVGIPVALVDLSHLPNWTHDGNLRLPQPLAIIQERIPDCNHSYIDFVFVGVAQQAHIALPGEILEAGWFNRAALERLDTSFPIKEMAANIFEREGELRSRAIERP